MCAQWGIHLPYISTIPSFNWKTRIRCTWIRGIRNANTTNAFVFLFVFVYVGRYMFSVHVHVECAYANVIYIYVYRKTHANNWQKSQVYRKANENARERTNERLRRQRLRSTDEITKTQLYSTEYTLTYCNICHSWHSSHIRRNSFTIVRNRSSLFSFLCRSFSTQQHSS